jgi:hypothetical protein
MTHGKIFLDLFIWLFALLGIFIILECRFPGFVVTYINLSLWFLATLVAGGIYLSLKSER